MRAKDPRVEQAERVLALLYNATYPGPGMWRFETACRVAAEAARAEEELGETDLSNSCWFSAAVRIFKMTSKNGLWDWCYFSPKEKTQIASAFLPVAVSLINWVNRRRKQDAEEQELDDWESIGFMNDVPEAIVLSKFGGYDDGPTVALLKMLLFTENERCEEIYNDLVFRQIDRNMESDPDYLDYVDPSDEKDVAECNAVIAELFKARAEAEERTNEPIPTLAQHPFQWFIENLSESNEAFLARHRTENAAICKKIDAAFPTFSPTPSEAPSTGWFSCAGKTLKRQDGTWIRIEKNGSTLSCLTKVGDRVRTRSYRLSNEAQITFLEPLLTRFASGEWYKPTVNKAIWANKWFSSAEGRQFLADQHIACWQVEDGHKEGGQRGAIRLAVAKSVS